MRKGLLHALLENGDDKVEQAVIRVDGILQIGKGGDMDKVRLGG